MKFIRNLVLCALIGASSFSYTAEKKPWTFLVYIAGDNDLASFADKDLDEMMQVGSNENVNVLVYLNIKRPGEEKLSARVIVHKGRLEYLDRSMAKDSGDVSTLMEALAWAHNDFPSEHMAVVLWNHGSGPLNRRPTAMRGICYDDTTGNYLTDRDCFNAFGTLSEKMGKKIDILACDACLMASLELAFTMQPFFNYFVASQETIPGNGYEYSYVLEQFEYGAPDARDVVETMVNVYADTYPRDEEYTLSAIDLDEVSQVVGRLDGIAEFFTNALQDERKSAVKKYLKQSLQAKRCLHFGGEDYVDLYQWLNNVLTYVPRMKLAVDEQEYIEDIIWNTMRYIRKSVMANVYSRPCRQAHGMSIYLPGSRIDSSYYDLLWSNWTSWLAFTQAYVDA